MHAFALLAVFCLCITPLGCLASDVHANSHASASTSLIVSGRGTSDASPVALVGADPPGPIVPFCCGGGAPGAYAGPGGGTGHGEKECFGCGWGFTGECHSRWYVESWPCVGYGGGCAIFSGGCSQCFCGPEPKCYDHDSTGECSWYLSCAEQVVPCQATDADYAATYGYYFCSRFSDRAALGYFSPPAVRWITEVRRCLQDALRPLLSGAASGSTTSCQTLKDAAFASHVQCYLNSADGICSLSAMDLMQVFWTIKGALLKALLPTIIQAIGVMQGCGGKFFQLLRVRTSQAAQEVAQPMIDRIDHAAQQIADLLNYPRELINGYTWPQLDHLQLPAVLLQPLARSSMGVAADPAPSLPTMDVYLLVWDARAMNLSQGGLPNMTSFALDPANLTHSTSGPASLPPPSFVPCPLCVNAPPLDDIVASMMAAVEAAAAAANGSRTASELREPEPVSPLVSVFSSLYARSASLCNATAPCFNASALSANVSSGGGASPLPSVQCGPLASSLPPPHGALHPSSVSDLGPGQNATLVCADGFLLANSSGVPLQPERSAIDLACIADVTAESGSTWLLPAEGLSCVPSSSSDGHGSDHLAGWKIGLIVLGVLLVLGVAMVAGWRWHQQKQRPSADAFTRMPGNSHI